jgi:hypothetical protein
VVNLVTLKGNVKIGIKNKKNVNKRIDNIHLKGKPANVVGVNAMPMNQDKNVMSGSIRNIKTRDVKLMPIAKNVNKMGTEPNAAKNLNVDLGNGVRNGEAKKLDEK